MSTKKNTFRHIGDSHRAAIMQNRGGQQVIKRILEAYGFGSRQALCKHLGISQSTMANRYARDTFPADWIVICNLETNASIEWLSFGTSSEPEVSPVEEASKELEKSDSASKEHHDAQINPNEITIHPNRGGRDAIERLVEAYGFKTRQALADHLGISKSTLANRYMRDTFPSDWIIKCSLETNVSLLWLTTGQGVKFKNSVLNVASVPQNKLVDNSLLDAGYLSIDKKLLAPETNSIFVITDKNKKYFANKSFDKITDGLWLVEYDNSIKLKEIYLLPDEIIRVSDEKLAFDCQKTDINFKAKVFSLYIPC